MLLGGRNLAPLGYFYDSYGMGPRIVLLPAGFADETSASLASGAATIYVKAVIACAFHRGCLFLFVSRPSIAATPAAECIHQYTPVRITLMPVRTSREAI